jgi:hypothetical protein
MDYLLKITVESIGNNRGSVDRIGKGGNCLLCYLTDLRLCTLVWVAD